MSVRYWYRYLIKIECELPVSDQVWVWATGTWSSMSVSYLAKYEGELPTSTWPSMSVSYWYRNLIKIECELPVSDQVWVWTTGTGSSMSVSYLAKYECERAKELDTLSVICLWAKAAYALQLKLLHLSHSSIYIWKQISSKELSTLNVIAIY